MVKDFVYFLFEIIKKKKNGIDYCKVFYDKYCF